MNNTKNFIALPSHLSTDGGGAVTGQVAFLHVSFTRHAVTEVRHVERGRAARRHAHHEVVHARGSAQDGGRSGGGHGGVAASEGGHGGRD